MYGHCGHTKDAQKSFAAIPRPSNISWTVLIRAFGHNGQVNMAKHAFSCAKDADVVTWNSMIGVYAKSKDTLSAMDLFERMQLGGPAPTAVTFVCIVDACSDLHTGFLIHSLTIMFQYEGNVTVANAIITMYGRCKNLVDAKRTFAGMTVKNLVTWSTLISQHTQNEKFIDAMQLFQDMLDENIVPNHITCVTALEACTKLGKILESQLIHLISVECHYEKNLPLANALINNYGKCGSLSDAKAVFFRIPSKNIISWSSLMGAYTEARLYEEAMQVFHQMQSESVKPDEVVYLHVLDACVGLEDIDAGQEIHACLIESGYASVIALANALINFYGKCGNLSHARVVFLNLNSRNVISWSTLISSFAQNGHDKEALSLLFEMQTVHIEPNDITIVGVLDAINTVVEGHIMHTILVFGKYEQSHRVQAALVNFYDTMGCHYDAMYTFRMITEKDAISWTSGIAACAHSENLREALNLFYQMLDHEVMPSSVTFVCLLDGCSNLAALEDGRKLHGAIIDSGHDNDKVVVNALITMYGKCGDVRDSVTSFWSNPQRDLVSWSAVLSSCSLNGQAAAALKLFNHLQGLELTMNAVIFLCILASCSHGGLLEEGIWYFVLFTRWHGLFPAEEHFACLIDLYGRAGQVDVAEQLIELIPFTKVASAVASLLGACRIQGDFDSGLRCAKILFDMDPYDTAAYIDAANLCASVNLLEW
ncbi:hypothetical protein KP509_25G070000 [Ceratopteris richardii]|nr:hypothetical protein KP509_25G070000 [Ceratopteris richardii]